MLATIQPQDQGETTNIFQQLRIRAAMNPIMNQLNERRNFSRLHSCFKSRSDFMIAQMNQGYKIFKDNKEVISEENNQLLDVKLVGEYYFYYSRNYNCLFKIKYDGSEPEILVKTFDSGNLFSSIIHVDSENNLILRGRTVVHLDTRDKETFRVMNPVSQGYRILRCFGKEKLLVLESNDKLILKFLEYIPYKKSARVLKVYENLPQISQLFNKGLYLNLSIHKPENLLVNVVNASGSHGKVVNFFRIKCSKKLEYCCSYRMEKLENYVVGNFCFFKLKGEVIMISILMKKWNDPQEDLLILSLFYDLRMKRVLKHKTGKVNGVKSCTDVSYLEGENGYFGVDSNLKKFSIVNGEI